MYSAPGIGSGSCTNWMLKRVIVIDVSKGDEKKSNILVNPEDYL